MKELQTADEFFAPQAQSAPQDASQQISTSSLQQSPAPQAANDIGGLPDADEFFQPQKPSIAVDPHPVSSPVIDEFLQKHPVGRIMSAFGSGFAEGGQGGSLGIEPGSDVENALKKYGIFNDYSKGQNDIEKAFNEALIRPAAVVLDNEFRGAQAAMGAVGAGIEQTAKEIESTAPYKAADVLLQKATGGYLGLQGGLSAGAEYFMTTPAGMEIHPIPPDIVKARSVGAIGESEASYFGLKEPTPEEAIARQHAAEMTPSEAVSEVPKDIHAVAREVAPEVFEKYDAINTQQDSIRTQIADLAAKRDEEMGINPPHADELQDVSDKIDTILGKVNNVESRLTKRQTANLEDLRSQFDDLSEKSRAAAGADTPEMAELRSQIQQLDYAKRDIAPDVSAAYREAQSRMPEEAAEQPEAQKAEANQEPSAAEEPTSEPTKPIEQQLQSIKDDVSKKLTEARRPAEESQAASELIAQHYKAIADQGWAKGTPEEIYHRDAANIVAGKERVRKGAREFNQSDLKRDLLIQHNLSESSLLHAHKMGGLPVPSLAITKKGTPLTKFGEITLIGSEDLANPKGYAATKVFGADIYSPRYPSISYKIKQKAIDKLNTELESYQKKFKAGDIYDPNDLNDGPRPLERNMAVMAKFLDEHGVNIEPILDEHGKIRRAATESSLIGAIRDNKLENEFTNYTQNLFDKLGAEEKIFRGFTNSGQRRYIEHNIDNVVKILKQELRGGENFNYGMGSIRAKFTPQFKSIEQIKKAKDRLIDEKSFEKIKSDIDDEFIAIADKLKSSYKYKTDSFGYYDQVSNLMGDAAKDGLPRALKEYGFDNIAPEDLQSVAEFLDKLKNLPTEYFEAKILREVGLSEFKGAVVPEGTSQEAINALRKKGVTDIKEYKRGDDADRASKIGEFENVYFQKARGKIRLATDDAKAAITLFKSADASTFIHETGHHWLDEMMRYAKEEDAPASLLKDRDTVNKWLGAKDGEEITRAQHEKFARGFERYLMEGTAPSKELANVFAKFKQWLTDIYQTVQRLKSPITDDIRDVFDRLLSANPEKTVIAPEREVPKAEVPTEVPQASTVAPQETGTPMQGAQPPSNAPEVQSAVAQSPTQVAPSPSISSEAAGEAKVTPEEQRNIADNANAKLPKAESKLVDKAGNIRLENLNTPEDVNQVIRETANENDNFMGARRGVISDGQVLDLADALGMDSSELSKRKLGQAFNAEQIVAARKLLIQSAESVRDLSAKAASGEESDLMAYAEARARHMVIQEQVSGITAEAGRALRAFRSLEGGQEAAVIGDFLKENTGLDLFQLQEEAKKLSELDTTQKVSKMLNDAKKPTYKDMILEYYINSLISGPITHLRYSVGNALNALWTPLVEIPTAAGIGALRETLTGEKIPDRVYLGEAGAQLHGIIQGSKNGLRAAADAWNTGVSPGLPGEEVSPMFATKTNAIPGTAGKIINIPSKGVSAIHSFFKSLRYEQNIQGMAYRTALQEGLTEGSEAFTNRIAELGTNPTEPMMESAVADTLKELYMTPTEYNSFAGKLTSAVNSNLAAKIIIPFMKIGSQITRNAFIERTPLGLLTEGARENALYKAGGVAGDTQLAKMATGVALMGGISAMVLEGLATGDGPSDPAKRAIWMLNHQPNSIQIGNVTLKYQGLGSLGMLMRFSANMTETASGWNEEEGTKLAKSFMEGITKSVLDENFMRGLKDLLDAVYHPDEYGANYIKQFATNWLPFSVGMSQVSKIVDPSQREAHTIMEAAMNKIPFVSENLEPKRNRFGEIMPNGVDERYASDPVVQRLESLQIGIGKINKKINGVQLTPQQYDDYSKLAGQQTKMRLNQYVAIPQTRDLPPEIQIKTINSLIEQSRAQAKQIVMMNNPDIYKQAAQNKINALTGKK